ncbi:MAG: hypothetical protein VB144_09195 [Clostridia bacterium]|nr:hypothetical protein [Clostridia bacterium]
MIWCLRSRKGARPSVLGFAVGILVAALTVAPGVAHGAEPQFKFSGSTTTKAYYQTLLRVSNSTTLSLTGDLAGWGISGSAVISGANWGVPEDSVMIGPWGEYLEKWGVRAGRGAMSLQLGDATIPALSGLYLGGRSLYGAVGSGGMKLGSTSSATATGFWGVNAVSSGLSVRSYKVWGGSLDLGLGRNLGTSLGYLHASREAVALGVGGVQAWLNVGSLNLSGEAVLSHDEDADTRGWTALGGAHTPALGGRLSASAQYTSPEFRSLNSIVNGKAGGIAEFTGTWSGNVLRAGPGAPGVDLSVAARYGADNVDGSLPFTTAKRLLETSVGLRTPWLPVLKAKYTLGDEKSNDGPSPSRDRLSRVLSLDAMAPLTLGGLKLDLAARAARTATENRVNGAVDTIDVLSVGGATVVGEASVSLKADISQTTPKPEGSRKREAELGFTLGMPLWTKSLSGTLELKVGDYRQYAPDGALSSQRDSLDAGLSLRYVPKPQIEAKAKYRQSWRFADGSVSNYTFDHWVEGEFTYRF